jgi:hypothetical protein
MVCGACYEPRHPQDFLRARTEKVGVPWSRPEAPDQFVLICDMWSSSSYADYGVADCLRADYDPGLALIHETFGTTAIAELAITGSALTGTI